jgi:hypothetical protein
MTQPHPAQDPRTGGSYAAGPGPVPNTTDRTGPGDTDRTGPSDTDRAGPSDTEHGARPLSSVGELIAEITQDLSDLVRQEAELAKAEIRQSASRTGKGAGMLGGAGLAGYLVLLFLSIALWWGLGNEIGRGWSALVVALLWAVVAAVLAMVGRKKLKEVRGIPRTTETAKQIPDALKGHEETR